MARNQSARKIVYMMRGLPSCGKSTTARRIVGSTGAVYETDQYFLTETGDDPRVFTWDEKLLPDARRWNFERFKKGVREGVTPIVVDRGNSLNLESHIYARYAVDQGYELRLREPESPWWQELRVLLKYKPITNPILDQWAEKLYELSRRTHRVPLATIKGWMKHWKWEVTVEDILKYSPRDDEESQFLDWMRDDQIAKSGRAQT